MLTNSPTSMPSRATQGSPARSTPVTPVIEISPDNSPSQHPIPGFSLPSYPSPDQNSISARLLADLDKLRPRSIKTSKTKHNLWLASIVCAVRYAILCLIAMISLRPRNDPIIWNFLSRRVTLYMLFVFAKIHFIVILARFYILMQLLPGSKTPVDVGDPLSKIQCSLCDRYLHISQPSFWKIYLLFEMCLYVVRLFDRLIHQQLPSCVACETKMRYRFKDVLRTLRLLDEDEIERRAFSDQVVFTINKNIEKGVSGPYYVSSVTPQDIVNGLQGCAENIESEAIIFAVSYAHKDRDPYSKSLSVSAAGALCNTLRKAELPCDTVYLWSDITLSQNAFARESWADDGLMPYIAYPTIRIGSHDTYWTEVELDVAHARNAQKNDDDILTFTRHLVARRRDRGHREDADVDSLLSGMRALALGMRPERGISGLQRAINTSLLVGPALREKTIVEELLPARWDGASEFVDEAEGLREDEHAYLTSAIAQCTCMFVLEKDITSFAVWIYKDNFDDCVVVVAKMELEAEGSYLIKRKVRLVPPAKEQRQLLELHKSPTSEISHIRMKELLARAKFFVNFENVGTRRVDHERIIIR